MPSQRLEPPPSEEHAVKNKVKFSSWVFEMHVTHQSCVATNEFAFESEDAIRGLTRIFGGLLCVIPSEFSGDESNLHATRFIRLSNVSCIGIAVGGRTWFGA